MRIVLLLLALISAHTSFAQLQIEIVNGNPSAIPIAVVPLAWQAQSPEPVTGVADIIAADLYHSGQFLPLDKEDIVERPTEGSQIRFGAWQALKSDYILVGQVNGDDNGGYQIYYYLYDVNRRDELLAKRLSVSPGSLRHGAHLIADDVYQQLLGKPGAFATRIAYITATGIGDNRLYELSVADADGYGPQSVVTSPEPLLSPSWSPDATKLAYVSFERGNSAIVVQDIYTGARELVASFEGINGAPAFSPDGRKLAMALSKSGNLEIYVHTIGSQQFTQLTRHWAIDTEPRWSPDGRTIYFTSDRSGKPQIYQISASGGDVSRLTFSGDENARISVAPDGRHFAVAQGSQNRYRIAVLDAETNRTTIVSRGPLDESPSFAPNGDMVLYASKERGRGVLYAVSADGNVRQSLVLSEGDVREPAWSPHIR